MSWRDRLRGSIKLTSPDGSIFNPLWMNDPRSKEKKLGIFTFPKVKGAIVQDLDVGATKYPLTLYFDGPDNDLESNRFFKACDERGIWQIIHPVHGALDLQLILVLENTSPTESGNITVFNTDWIEPIKESFVLSAAQLKSMVGNQVNVLNSISSDQVFNNSVVDTAGEISAFESTVNDVVNIVDKTLKPIYEFNSDISSRISSIKRGIDAALSVPLDILSIAGQIQALIQLPALAIQDIKSRLDVYRNFADTIFNLSPDNHSNESRNIIAIQELSLMACIASYSLISITGDITSRLQTIEVIDNNADLFNDITDNLDVTQELFIDNAIDMQYFSQSESFNDSIRINTLTLQYLLRALFDLAIEKRFILDKPRAPIEITITEYKELGQNDINFDLFIESNFLKGNEIFILPAGREVVVYV